MLLRIGKLNLKGKVRICGVNRPLNEYNLMYVLKRVYFHRRTQMQMHPFLAVLSLNRECQAKRKGVDKTNLNPFVKFLGHHIYSITQTSTKTFC